MFVCLTELPLSTHDTLCLHIYKHHQVDATHACTSQAFAFSVSCISFRSLPLFLSVPCLSIFIFFDLLQSHNSSTSLLLIYYVEELDKPPQDQQLLKFFALTLFLSVFVSLPPSFNNFHTQAHSPTITVIHSCRRVSKQMEQAEEGLSNAELCLCTDYRTGGRGVCGLYHRRVRGLAARGSNRIV